MGRVIKDQAIASTALDRHGEQLSEAELRFLFSQMPDERFLNLNHDLRQPPIARAFNTRLEPRGDVLAIVSDIEILDEAAIESARVTGFSISYHRDHPVTEPDRGNVVVSFNPLSVERGVIEDAVSSADLPPGWVAISERADKGLFETVALIYLIVANGFFDEAGADLYRLWKALAERAAGLDKPANVVLRSPPTDDLPEVIVQPDPRLDPEALMGLELNALIQQARDITPDQGLIRVVVEVDASGKARLDVVIDASGTPRRPSDLIR
jgi:hypothetical protein